MRIIHISQPGPPEVLQVAEREKPSPKPGEILIKVKAAGINRPDVFQRMGKYPAPKDAPADIPGLEVAGHVAQVAEGVNSFSKGMAVCALLSGGGYAEYVAVPAPQCLPIPPGISMEEAASIPETFFTVWNNVFDLARFSREESVLVHGGSSGIGVAAIQMIKAMGGKVYVTAGSDEKCLACEELGADKAINYKKEDFVSRVKSLTADEGVDIVLDMVGGDYVGKNIEILKHNGCLVMINAMQGRIGTINLMQVIAKQLVITGSLLRPRSVEYKGKIAQSLYNHIWPLIPSRIRPVVFKSFALEEAAKAHRLMETSSHIGKIILVVK